MLPVALLITMEIAAAQSPALPPDYSARLAALEQEHRADPRNLEVLDALAGSYAMGGHYGQAIATLRQMLELRPKDASLQLRLARNYAWAGDSQQAIARYQDYLKAEPEDRQATIELIRLRRYRGDYSEAEKLCNGLLKRDPDDAEALALKAEVLHWAGDRRLLARRTAERAVRLAADSPDAKVAQVYASRDLGENRRASREFAALADQVSRRGGPAAESTYRDAYRLLEEEVAHPPKFSETPAYSFYNDSDGIHNDYWGLRLAAPVRGDHTALLDLSQRISSAPAGGIFTAGRDQSELREFMAGGTIRVAPGAYFTALGGGSIRQSESELRPIYSAQVSASPFDRWTFDLAAGREFLSVTPRAMDRDISSKKMAGGIRYAFDSRTSVALHAERRHWSDSNRSLAGDATLRRILHYHKPFLVDGGVLTHWEQFERDTHFDAGFFTPDRYFRHDAFLGLHGEVGRFNYEVRGAGGAQQVARAADFRPDWEATASASLRLGRSIRLAATYQRRNYSLLSRDGWYQGAYFSLEARP